MTFRRTIVAIVVAIVVSGCAALPEIPYDRMGAGEIKRIGLIPPSLPKSASVILASSPGQSFGLVGAIVDATLQARREGHFRMFLEDEHFSTQDVFTGRLKQQIEMQGYTVTTVNAIRSGPNFVTKFPMDSDVDAFLDVLVTNYGYISAGVGNDTPYRPQFLVQVRLIRAKDSAVLLQDTIVYNPYKIGPTAYDSRRRGQIC